MRTYIHTIVISFLCSCMCKRWTKIWRMQYVYLLQRWVGVHRKSLSLR